VTFLAVVGFLLGCAPKQSPRPTVVSGYYRGGYGGFVPPFEGGLLVGKFTPGTFVEEEPEDEEKNQEIRKNLDEAEKALTEQMKEKEREIDDFMKDRDKEDLTDEEKEKLEEMVEELQDLLDILDDILEAKQKLWEGELEELMGEGIIGGAGMGDLVEKIWEKLREIGIFKIEKYALVGLDIPTGKLYYNVWYIDDPTKDMQKSGGLCQLYEIPVIIDVKTKKLYCMTKSY